MFQAKSFDSATPGSRTAEIVVRIFKSYSDSMGGKEHSQHYQNSHLTMPDILPFKGIFFNKEKVDIDEVVCPPYDIISKEQQKNFKRLSKYNAINLELPDFDYSKTRCIFERWLKKRILVRDKSPSFYFYKQVFKINDKEYTRKGFFCMLSVDKSSISKVISHEKTFQKPIQDRLTLLKNLNVFTSPVFMLYEDEGIISELEKNLQEKFSFKFDDHRHFLYGVNDTKIIKELQKKLKEKDFFIADGHHRFKTAKIFFKKYSKNIPRYLLIYLCQLESSGLICLPLHRLVINLNPEELLKQIKKNFELTEIPLSHLKKVGARLKGLKDSIGLLCKIDKKFFSFLIKLKRDIIPSKFLHNEILSKFKGFQIIYSKDFGYILNGSQKKNVCGFLLPAFNPQKLKEFYREGQVLPEKSTYFYPKVGAGIVMADLRNKKCII